MRTLLSGLALALGLLLPCLTAPAPAAADPPTKAEEPPAATVLVLTDKGPLLLALDLRIDGKPVREVFEAARAVFLDKLFAWLDRNNDKSLDAAEAARLPMSLVSMPGLRAAELEAVHIAYNFDAIDADGNGKVSKTELRDFLTEFGLNPLTVAVDNPVESVQSGLQVQFFQALDVDHDGKLSAKELNLGAAFIAKHDGDEDERIDIYEVLGGVPSPPDAGLAELAIQRQQNPAASAPRVLVLDAERRAAGVGRILLDHYGQRGGKVDVVGLTADLLGIDGATFKKLDINKDGLLDADELDGFADLPPQCALRARLGKRDEKAALLEAMVASKAVKITGEGQFRIGGKVWAEGRTLPGLVDDGLAGNLARGYKLAFDAADRNGDGKIDADERKNSPLFAAVGEAVDRDGNGTIDAKEVTAWVDEVVKPLAAVLVNRASITISQPGQGIWDLLDVNRDGFLSERELRRAPGLLKELDRNGDGFLQADEVPAAYLVAVGRGEATLGSRGRFVRLELAADGRVMYPSRQDLGGPGWFRKMDRNGDGDVSAKEFLGTPEQFRKLDADGDGLISLEEAEAAQK